MNVLFIEYSILLLISVASIYFLTTYTIKKVLGLKEWLFITIGIMFVGFLSVTLTKGIEVNDKLSVEFKVPKDFYSENEYVQDSIVTDKILYNYLLDMRVNNPKVILCQAKIESATYTSINFKKNKNMFGMKNTTSRTTVGGNSRGDYQKYNSWKESVIDYVFWQFSHNVDKLNQDEYLGYLGKIYAEDPNYVVKIRKMLKEINFKSLEY